MRELLERYGGPVPRYTSYPTAPHFHAGVDAEVYSAWLGTLGPAPVSLYLHVPFCAAMCWYCGCHTKVARRYEPIAAYRATLVGEIDLVGAALPGRRPVTRIHWGGGTPTMLRPGDFRALMAHLRRAFAVVPEAEVAVEIDPRTLTDEMVRALAASGVNRASLGIQDFNPHVQRAINRVQPYSVAQSAVTRLRDAGVRAVNLDLMYGLPHQSVADVGHSVELALRLAPDRLALFGYAHVPWMKRHQRLIPETALPDAATRLEQFAAAEALLVAQGYRRIGLDHFALARDSLAAAAEAGTLRRNFQGYTDDTTGTLLGFGASAIGVLPQGYVQNEVAFGAYRKRIARRTLATARGLALEPDDRVRRTVIERLMCADKLDLAALGFTSVGGFADELRALGDMAAHGLIEIAGSEIRITERGRPWRRRICAIFDRYLARGTARHSTAV